MATFLGVAQVRVGNTAAESNWADGTDVTDNSKVRQKSMKQVTESIPQCSDNVDGVETGGNTKQWARCQNRKGFFQSVVLDFQTLFLECFLFPNCVQLQALSKVRLNVFLEVFM